MRIAIFGTGGVGGYFGGLLAHAGHQVVFIARGEHLRAIQEQGLRVQSSAGSFHIHPAQATDDPAQVGPVDYVIVAVKHYHLDQAVRQMPPLVGAGTTVVPLLNGVDAHETLIRHLGRDAVVGGLCSVMAMIAAPGVIRQEGDLRRIVVGELDGRPSARLERLVEAWRACGVQAEQAEDIYAALWSKFLFIAPLSGVAALSRASVGELRRIAPTRRLLQTAMEEVAMLAHASQVALPEDAVDQAMALVDSLPQDATASMQRDVMDGKPFELEAFSGAIVRMAEAHGMDVPVHRALYALLRPQLDRAMEGGQGGEG
jgi:2-dehydropantoate 2-reductase